MSLPIVAIVGRPNVGKSSLLNTLVGKKVAIVDPTPGVTRDRLSVVCPIGDVNVPDAAKYVELVDTGGIGIVDVDALSQHVEDQIEFAIQSAAVILFLVDAREGIVPLDRQVAARLRKLKKPVILVANKMDQPNLLSEIGEMNSLGFGDPMPVSAAHVLGLTDLMERINVELGDVSTETPPSPVMKLAIVGKRNAGKSTFINALAGEERVIVSEVAGTTRDSVDVNVQLDGRTFTVIDTAGIQKRRSLSGDIAFYSLHRAMRSIRRADVVALMIDASVPISQVDKELAGEIFNLHKPVVLVINKWDLATADVQGEDYREYFSKVMPELSFAPITLTTAKEGTNVRETIAVAEELFRQSQTRVPTHQLNEAVQQALEVRGPSHKSGTKPPKLLYASQIAICPPSLVCFVNDIRSFDQRYQRFMVNQLRERLPFSEVPIRLFFRQRKGKARDELKTIASPPPRNIKGIRITPRDQRIAKRK